MPMNMDMKVFLRVLIFVAAAHQADATSRREAQGVG